MTPEEHRQRHEFLHRCADELLADFITMTGRSPDETTVMELMRWSYQQTIKPDTQPVSFTTRLKYFKQTHLSQWWKKISRLWLHDSEATR